MSIPVIHWKGVLGNPYRFKIHPDMLTDEGYQLEKVVNLKGGSKFSGQGQFVRLHFDSEYVTEYLARQLQPIAELPIKDVQKLISQSVKLARQIAGEKQDGADTYLLSAGDGNIDSN